MPFGSLFSQKRVDIDWFRRFAHFTLNERRAKRNQPCFIIFEHV
jgi:hypothetical protein